MTGRGPTIVMLHGYGGDKSDFEETRPEGDDPDSDTTYHWNNNFFARQGYAVINYTARGFRRSCGESGNRSAPPCSTTRSYLHLADQRGEARDTQHVLGRLADQGIARPRDIGVTVISYGGGQSTELAYLRNRIRRPNGSFAPWRSPGGKAMEIGAAFPRWLWSDLVNSLLPNGRFLDFRPPRERDGRNPLGIKKETYVDGLFALRQHHGDLLWGAPHVGPARSLATTSAPTSASGSRG